MAERGWGGPRPWLSESAPPPLQPQQPPAAPAAQPAAAAAAPAAAPATGEEEERRLAQRFSWGGAKREAEAEAEAAEAGAGAEAGGREVRVMERVARAGKVRGEVGETQQWFALVRGNHDAAAARRSSAGLPAQCQGRGGRADPDEKARGPVQEDHAQYYIYIYICEYIYIY